MAWGQHTMNTKEPTRNTQQERQTMLYPPDRADDMANHPATRHQNQNKRPTPETQATTRHVAKNFFANREYIGSDSQLEKKL